MAGEPEAESHENSSRALLIIMNHERRLVLKPSSCRGCSPCRRPQPLLHTQVDFQGFDFPFLLCAVFLAEGNKARQLCHSNEKATFRRIKLTLTSLNILRNLESRIKYLLWKPVDMRMFRSSLYFIVPVLDTSTLFAENKRRECGRLAQECREGKRHVEDLNAHPGSSSLPPCGCAS